MITRAGFVMLPVLAAVSMTWAVDVPGEPSEPPARLKKKEKPPEPEGPRQKTDPVKTKATNDDPEPWQEIDKEKNPAEILARVAKNMRSSEERLGKRDAGEATREIQRTILKDIDSLIEQSKRQQQQQKAQQQAQQNAQQSRQNQDKRQARPKPEQSDQRSLTKQPTPGDQPNDAAVNRRGKSPRDGMSKIADLYKDVWGHLPESLRQEMDQYSREKFMNKYEGLLKQYYTTIAEKGHRQGE